MHLTMTISSNKMGELNTLLPNPPSSSASSLAMIPHMQQRHCHVSFFAFSESLRAYLCVGVGEECDESVSVDSEIGVGN